MYVAPGTLYFTSNLQPAAERTDGFTLSAWASLESLARFYGFPLPVAESGLTVGDYLARACRGRPAIGERTAWERVELVVLELAGETITKVRLRIVPLCERRRSHSDPTRRADSRRMADRRRPAVVVRAS